METGHNARWPGWCASALALATYAVALAVATWPVFGRLTTSIPGPSGDTFQHLWILRWSRSCLLAGRAPFFCPDIQVPVGAPLGLFSPMHVETLLYTVLASVLDNDVLIYNGIWLFGLLGTGMGTFLLAWFVVRDRASAIFGGLGAVLSTPLMMHGQGHLELIQLGIVGVFLICWLRFIDRPSLGRLLGAWASFALAGASAAYLIVLTPFPAAWYVLWCTYKATIRGHRAWLRSRIGPVLGFVALTVPVVIVLLSSQVWAVRRGFTVSRSWSEFEWNGVPPWSYLVPTALHRLGRLMEVRTFESLGGDAVKAYETASYLGAVPLALLMYAAIRRVKLPRAGFWWSVLGVLVVLSMGATLRYGRMRVDLPGAWLWSAFPPFRMIRVPARFNLLACVVASVLAAGGLRDLISRLTPGRAWAVWLVLVVLTVADLSVSPFMTTRPPTRPAGYAVLDRIAPRATVLDAPMMGSGDAHPLSALTAYWQSRRGGRTTAGYSGHANVPFDHLMVYGSPFGARELADATYLANPERQTFGIVQDVPFLDYVWLYLTAHQLDYVMLHHWEGSVHRFPVRFDRLKAAMAGSRIAEDAATTIYDRARLPRPSGPIALCGSGWRTRPGWPGAPTRVVLATAGILAYSPGEERELVFQLRASAFHVPRQVRLLADGVELARWRVEPGEQQTYFSPPFRLREGVNELSLASDGVARPRRHREAFDDGLTPYSLRVTRISLEPAILPAQVADRPAGVTN